MKIPSVEKLPSGAYRVRVQVDGRRVSRNFATERDAVAFAAGVKAGKERAGTSVTLTKAIDNYIAVRENILSPATIRGYRTIQKNRFQALMHKPLSSISAAQWAAAINGDAKDVSAKTLKNAWMFIASVIKENGHIVPTVKMPQVIPAEKAWLTPEQIPVFIQALKGTRVEIPALLALHGLRRSELLALTWDMIDTENGVLHVSGAVVQGPDGQYIRKRETKTVSSRRDVPILIPELNAAIQAADHTKPVVSYGPNSIADAVNNVCQKNNLPQVGVHGLRHSFASLCYHLEVPEKVVMQLGGWSDNGTMRKIYTHLAKKDVMKNVDVLRDFFQIGHESGHAKGNCQ